MPRRTPSPDAGKNAFEGLDRALHEKARLAILTSLLANPDGLRFNELKELCSLTDGNLSRHLQLLKDEELIEIWKGIEQNRPQTLCRLTRPGRERFLAYLDELEKVLRQASESATAESEPVPPPPGWVKA